METKELIIESKKHGRFVVLYDADDEEIIAAHKWYVSDCKPYGKIYINTVMPHPDDSKRKKTTKLHRLIINAPKGMHADHINGNTLDNRKENLRLCTCAQNQWNRGPNKNNKSGFKGVSTRARFAGKSKPWKAAIMVNRKTIQIGFYATPEEAARAYDIKAKELHGEFAYLNFPDE